MPASGVEAPKPRSFSPERDERTNITTPGTDGTSLLGDASRTAPRNAAIPGGSERGDARTRPGRRRLVPVGPPQAAEGALRPAVPSIERHPEWDSCLHKGPRRGILQLHNTEGWVSGRNFVCTTGSLYGHRLRPTGGAVFPAPRSTVYGESLISTNTYNRSSLFRSSASSATICSVLAALTLCKLSLATGGRAQCEASVQKMRGKERASS